MFMFNSFAAIEPVSSVVVKSTTLDYSQKEEGSWKYTKTAKWISKGKARIKIKLETIEKPRADYTDVILVLDTSGSMLGDKLTQVQSDVNELINDTIPKGNKISIVTFSDAASVITDFTSDTALLQESINSLVASGETNYYQALVKVDDVLSTYTKKSNRDCVVLFLTDGLPTVDTPNEIGQYKYLKSKYNYLDINGIQYELGDEVLDGIKNITDTQYIANMESLNEFLYQASITSANYDNLILTDYVDTNYFNLNNVTNVNTTIGKATIIDNRVIWNLSGLKSSSLVELTIDINLNNNLIGVGGVYPTHTKTDVSYKIGSINTTESSTETIILKDNYVVTYDANTPTGCVVSGVPSSKTYSVFDKVKIEDTVPTCTGYQFKEWEVVTKEVKKSSGNYFIMPESNVTIKAIWKKVGLVKSLDGKISKVQTLYKLIAKGSRGLDTGVDFSQRPTTDNSGIYTMASTKDDEYPVHYYRGIIDNNNVLFAGFCWKMVRTTSTGGVKLIYNGIYDETNKCNNLDTATLMSESAFNTNYSSPADVGYMYGTRYVYNSTGKSSKYILYLYSVSSDSNYYYGDSVTYSNGTYTLTNSSQKTWSDNYSSLVGYYTCRSTSTTCSTVYYIAGSTSSYQYIISLSGGITDSATQTITLGKNMIDNGDGTYSLTELVTIKKRDWFTTYSTYNGYYMCRDLTSTTCENKNLIISTDSNSIIYDNTFNYVYGNDVTWDGVKYTLTDTFTSTNFWPTDRITLAKKYHYTCLNITGECTDVYYISFFGKSTGFNYLKLSSGKNIEDAKNEMFTNTNDSKVKQAIDSWYAANMVNYTEKLEDTIWCNDRTIYSGSLVGKNENAGTGATYFSAYNRLWKSYIPIITCPNEERDGFTVSTASGGNGKLTYPVGLLTADEVKLAEGNNLSSAGTTGYWGMSPITFKDQYAYVSTTNNIGSASYHYVYFSYEGVRPSISLAKGTRYIDGDGTADNPYVIGDE